MKPLTDSKSLLAIGLPMEWMAFKSTRMSFATYSATSSIFLTTLTSSSTSIGI